MSIFSLLLSSLATMAQSNSPNITCPAQPAKGYGGKAYIADSVRMTSYAAHADGFWLFEPMSPMPKEAPVVIFMHGYGAINPMVYGGWIRHLVQRGNVVIYPRYQWDVFPPRSETFVPNAVHAIKDAYKILHRSDHPDPIGPPVLVGHSYGGTISAHIAARAQQLDIPQPAAVLLAAPGTGPLRGGLLTDYSQMPADLQLLIVTHQDDYVVGRHLGAYIFKSAVHTPHRRWLHQTADPYGPGTSAGHNETYALDPAFDVGISTFTSRRAKRIARTDAMNYFGYWKWLDALIDSVHDGCPDCWQDPDFLTDIGCWSDGKVITGLQLILPE